MKSIILCEGKTDLILYSYYLNKLCGWQFIDINRAYKSKSKDRLLKMTINNRDTQEYNWYYRENDILCIYAVGSKYNFINALEEIVLLNLAASNDNFDKVVIISDRDDSNSEVEIIKNIWTYFSKSSIKFKHIFHNKWNVSDDYDDSGNIFRLALLPLIIPFNESGTIEIFMLNCRKEISDGENTLIEDIYRFIDELAENNYVKSNYLQERGLIPKSKLSTYFSIVSPNRTFDVGNKILESIPWERYTEFHKTLHLLSEI